MKLINIKKIVPIKFKQIVKNILFIIKYRFFPPPYYTDMSGYEFLLDTIIQEKIYELEGDFVEIGVFLGGGTYKLSKLIEKLKVDKKIYAIDIFDSEFDQTICLQGVTMSELYKKILKDKNQYEIYKKITKNCKNIITIIGDSKQVVLSCKKIAFAYIDGNHSSEYVKNDFYLVWDKLVQNGIVSFDDYGYDLPCVTKAVDELINEKREEILKIWIVNLKTIFIKKK